MSANGSVSSDAVSQFLNTELDAENVKLRRENADLKEALQYAREDVLTRLTSLVAAVNTLNTRLDAHEHMWSGSQVDANGQAFIKCLGLNCNAIHYK